jgi:hypothetical protein
MYKKGHEGGSEDRRHVAKDYNVGTGSLAKPNSIVVFARPNRAARLALSHIQSNRARVIILEVLERKVALTTHLVTHRLACSTITRGNSVRATRGNAEAPKLRRLGRLIGIACLLVCSACELRKVDLACARDGERRRLEVLLLGEEEDDGASLASVRSGDVEVEDGAGVRVDFAVVGSSWGRVGGGRVYGDDEVGVLIVAVQVCRAGCRGWSGGCGLRGWVNW